MYSIYIYLRFKVNSGYPFGLILREECVKPSLYSYERPRHLHLILRPLPYISYYEYSMLPKYDNYKESTSS